MIWESCRQMRGIPTEGSWECQLQWEHFLWTTSFKQPDWDVIHIPHESPIRHIGYFLRFMSFSNLLLLIFNFIPLWSKNILCIFSVLSHVLSPVVWHSIWSVLQEFTWKGCVALLLLCGEFRCVCYAWLIYSAVQVFYTLVFCHLLYWSLQLSLLTLSISHFISVSFNLVYLQALFLGAYMFITVVSSWWIDPFY